MTKKDSQNGSLTIEACVALTLFIFLTLTLYSFFVIFGAQAKIKVTMLHSAESLSLDPYLSEDVINKVTEAGSIQDLLLKFTVFVSRSSKGYVSTEKWHVLPDDGTQAKVIEAAKQRFLAYFSDGDKDKADQILRSFRVVNGWDGLSFAGTNVDADGNVNIVISYKQKYFFDYPLFGLETINRTEVVKSRMWVK